MASRVLPIPSSRSTPLAELIARQRPLALYGLALLMLALVGAAMQIVDPRVLASGVSVWVKPVKFLVSVGVFALTAAWFFGYIRPTTAPRSSGATRTARPGPRPRSSPATNSSGASSNSTIRPPAAGASPSATG